MIQRYALGCAFNISDLFFNFPYKKLKLNCRDCLQITGDAHRSLLVKKIFRASMKIVIEDIVEHNVTFWLPLTGDKKCNMHMKRVSGKDFQKLRQAGKWDDIDIVNSNFSGYEIGFYMLGKRTPRVKTVYVNKKTKEIAKGFTYSLLNIWENNYKKTANITNEKEWNNDNQKRLTTKSYIPLFKYKLRLIKNREIREDVDKNGIKFMPWIKTPVSWVSLRLR